MLKDQILTKSQKIENYPPKFYPNNLISNQIKIVKKGDIVAHKFICI